MNSQLNVIKNNSKKNEDHSYNASMNGNVNTYRTKDFYLATLLRALNYSLTDIEPSIHGSYVTFVFHDPKNNALKSISDYWDRRLPVDARAFVESINELKTRIHSYR